MRASDIQVGYIYYVDYEPVRQGEFNGRHLSAVLKKNIDGYTFVVMPMKSSANGDGVNKVNIGKIASLPPNIRDKNTYAVYNQVRTVNANRFIALKSGDGRIEVPLKRDIWLALFDYAVYDMLFHVGQDDTIAIHKRAYDRARFSKAKDIAYHIIRLRKSGADEESVAALKTKIRDALHDTAYILDAAQIADGIQGIFDEALQP